MPDRFLKSLVALAVALLAGTRVDAAVIFQDDFSSYTATGDLTAVYPGYTAVQTIISLSETAGVGGGNALVSSGGDLTTVRRPTGGGSAIALAHGPGTLLIDFKFAANGISVPQIGFTTMTGNFTGAGDLSARVNSTGRLELRNNNTAVLIGESPLGLTAGNWYQLQFTLTRTETAGQFNGIASVYTLDGSTGAVGSLVDSVSTTLNSTTVYNLSAAYAAIRVSGGAGAVYDNFTLTQAVPEPAMLGGMGLAGLMLLRRRALKR